MHIETMLIVLFIMLFCHCIADYTLQGWLAQAKCKKYWEENAPEKKYKNDYKMALVVHSFMWAFLVVLPLLIVIIYKNCEPWVYYFWMSLVGINTIVHYQVDDLKANDKTINLCQDQILHVIQIVLSWLVIVVNILE